MQNYAKDIVMLIPKNKIIPDQILATVASGDWVSSLPNTVFVSDSNNITDKVIEYWDVSFAKGKNGGRVIFQER